MTYDSCYYTPERIAHHLRNWGELKALVESLNTARGLSHPGATPEEPRIHKQRGHHGDPYRHADVRADLTKAWAVALTYNSLEWAIVLALMQGHSLPAYADAYHLPMREVEVALDKACAKMAMTLGWVEPNEPAPRAPGFEGLSDTIMGRRR